MFFLSFTIGPLVEQTMDNIKQTFDTNTFAILRVCKAAVPHMAKRRSGTIVNIGSIVGEMYAVFFLQSFFTWILNLISSTPWNGLYSATKAAVNSISEVLFMELKPFNISVLHVAPGGVKSNISSNAIAGFALAPDTLYSNFLSFVIRRIHTSQGPDSMPSKRFAQQVVSSALRKNPPRYMSIGGHSWLFACLKWLPRGAVLAYMWRLFAT
jgi:NAD(P)-dependent dehydrogenase (short-subunit alcohol dehydrogenase family)